MLTKLSVILLTIVLLYAPAFAEPQPKTPSWARAPAKIHKRRRGKPMQIDVTVFAGHAVLDSFCATVAVGDSACLSADGANLTLGIGIKKQWGAFRFGAKGQFISVIGGSATAMGIAPTVEVGFATRWVDGFFSHGFGYLWMGDRRRTSQHDWVMPSQFSLAVKLTKNFAIMPRVGLLIASKNIGYFYGGGIEWSIGS